LNSWFFEAQFKPPSTTFIVLSEKMAGPTGARFPVNVVDIMTIFPAALFTIAPPFVHNFEKYHIVVRKELAFFP
jgi:hypothetical protein